MINEIDNFIFNRIVGKDSMFARKDIFFQNLQHENSEEISEDDKVSFDGDPNEELEEKRNREQLDNNYFK